MSRAERAALSPAAIRLLVACAGRPGAPRTPRALRADQRIVGALLRRGLLRQHGDLYAITDDGLRAIHAEEASC